MTLEKKVQPRGFSEVSNFVERLCDFSYKENLTPSEGVILAGKNSIEKEIDNFVEDALRRRLSVVKSLVYKLEECQHVESKANIICFILSRCAPDRSLDVIMEMVKDPSVSDSMRRRLLLILEKYHNNEAISEAMSYFTDKTYIVEQGIKSLLSQIGPEGDSLGAVVNHLTNASPEFLIAFISCLQNKTEESVVWLLGALAEFHNNRVAEAAIEVLGSKKSPLAYEILDNLVIHGKSKKELKLRMLDQLSQAGVSKINYRLLVPHKCYLSWIDGHGSRMLLISRKIGKGRLSMVSFLMNETNGFQECSNWPDISNFELETMIREWEREVGLKQIDYSVAVTIVEDCLATIIENKKNVHPSFLFTRRIFGSQRLEPKRYPVNLTTLGIEHVHAKKKDLLKNSVMLTQMFPFSEWWLDSPECQDFVKNKRSIAPGQKIRRDILTQFIKTILEEKRAVLGRRLLMTADFMHQVSPRLYREHIEICLALYLAMAEGSSLQGIPFFEELATINIRNIQESYLQVENEA